MILTVLDLSHRWRCSRNHIYKQVKAGRLPHFLIGEKTIRFKLSDIEEYERCASSSTEANGASTGGTPEVSLSDARLARLSEQWPNASLLTSEAYNQLVQQTLRES